MTLAMRTSSVPSVGMILAFILFLLLVSLSPSTAMRGKGYVEQESFQEIDGIPFLDVIEGHAHGQMRQYLDCPEWTAQILRWGFTIGTAPFC